MGLFQPATETTPRLRMTFVGTAGSGKTFSMLLVGTELANSLGRGRVAVIDTEHGSSAKYRRKFKFDILNLNQFDPRNYIEAIQAAEAEGYDVLGIDSLSHAWFGRGGELELVDKAAKKSQSKNTYFAWRDVTPLHNALVDCILQSNCHIIATMRSKTDYDQQTDPSTGKIKPVKIGLAPVMREGMDFEFDIVGDIDTDHSLTITKTRCEALDGQVIFKPGRQLAHTLVEWLTDGNDPALSPVAAMAPMVIAPTMAAPAASTAAVSPMATSPAPVPSFQSDLPSNDLIRLDEVARLSQLIVETGTDDFQVRGMLARRGVSAINRLLREDALEIITKLEGYARQLQAEREIQATRTPMASEPTPAPDPVVDGIMASIQTGSPVTADTIEAAQLDTHPSPTTTQEAGTEVIGAETIGVEAIGTEAGVEAVIAEDDVTIADVTRPEPKPKETKPRKSKKGDTAIVTPADAGPSADTGPSATDAPATPTLEESMAAL